MGWHDNGYENFNILVGKTLTGIKVTDDEVYFTCESGEQYKSYHNQDCCEQVYIESVVGDINDLLGSPLVCAEEVSSGDLPPLDSYEESYTWTFYKLDTIRGGVTIRFYGTSNGYYSESVDFIQILN
jgi:hypothetical protein